MVFANIESLTAHLTDVMGYDPAIVQAWLRGFAPEDLPDLLSTPLDPLIASHPITKEEAVAKASHLAKLPTGGEPQVW